jgi:transposase
MTNRSFKSGASRQQPSFLPARIEDYVDRSNPVRAIDAYGDALDVEKVGFRHSGSGGGAGQPPYHPRDLLKLYVYGYVHGIRSSRRLEREVRRNLELIWLLKGLEPGYRTIANFRKDNWAALKAVCREFVLMMRELGLVGGECVAIDGAFSMATLARRASRRARSWPNGLRPSTGISRLMAPPLKRTTPRRRSPPPQTTGMTVGTRARTLRKKLRR